MSTDTGLPIDDVGPGDRVDTEPIEGVTLEIHGLAAGDRGPIMILAHVETEGMLAGIYQYRVVDVDDDAEEFVAVSDTPHTHTRAEEAIEAIGGRVGVAA